MGGSGSFGGNEGFVNLDVRDRDGVWIFLIGSRTFFDQDGRQYLRLRERGLREGDLRPSSRSTREGLLSFEEKCLVTGIFEGSEYFKESEKTTNEFQDIC